MAANAFIDYYRNKIFQPGGWQIVLGMWVMFSKHWSGTSTTSNQTKPNHPPTNVIHASIHPSIQPAQRPDSISSPRKRSPSNQTTTSPAPDYCRSKHMSIDLYTEHLPTYPLPSRPSLFSQMDNAKHQTTLSFEPIPNEILPASLFPSLASAAARW